MDLNISNRRRAWISIGVMLGVFLGALEGTVVVTAMPTVVSTLGRLELYSWVYSIYYLSVTCTLPLWGRMSDLYGRKIFYLLGISLFTGGSILCGLSGSMSELILYRGIQGIGAGALVPLGQTIIGDIYSLEQRARMQGLFSAVWGFSSVLGPLAGGVITDYFSWRWVFFLNIPFGAAAAVIITLALVEPKDLRKRQIDYAGAVLLVTSLALFLLTLDQWAGRNPAVVMLTLAASGALMLLFLWVERRAADPIIPLEMFRDRIFSAAAVNGLFTGMALFGAISFIPLFVQGVLGTSALQAGWTLTPLILSWVVVSMISSRLILVIGYRRSVITGMSLLTAGFALLARQHPDSSFFQLMTATSLLGVGMGMSVVPMLIAVQNRFPRRYLGIATSSTQFFRMIGAAVGVSIMGSVMTREMLGRLSALQQSVPSEELARIARNPDLIVNPLTRASISPELLDRVQAVLGSSLHSVFLTGLVISLLAFASAFLVPPGKARELAKNS